MANVTNRHCQWPRRAYRHCERRSTDGAEKGQLRRSSNPRLSTTHAVQPQLLLSSGITWTLATILCKLAILWLYTQIFTTRKFKLAAYTLMGVTVSYAFIFIPIFFTQCKPVHAAWDPVLSLTSCRPITRQEFASVAINMALDLAVVVLPLPVVWSLRMPTRKKVAVSLMFSLGLVYVLIRINFPPPP